MLQMFSYPDLAPIAEMEVRMNLDEADRLLDEASRNAIQMNDIVDEYLDRGQTGETLEDYIERMK